MEILVFSHFFAGKNGAAWQQYPQCAVSLKSEVMASQKVTTKQSRMEAVAWLAWLNRNFMI